MSYVICEQQRRSLISAFVVRCQDRMIPLVYISEISRFLPVSVAEQVSLCLAWSETPEDTFSHDEAQVYYIVKTSNKQISYFDNHVRHLRILPKIPMYGIEIF